MDSSTDSNVMLTTIDNPWNPFTQFDEWFACDTFQLHHNTCQLIDRLSYLSHGLSPSEEQEELNRVYEQIVKSQPYEFINGFDEPQKIYYIVTPSDYV